MTTAAIAPRALVSIEQLLQEFNRSYDADSIRSYTKSLEEFAGFLSVGSISDVARLLVDGTPGEANYLALQYRNDLQKRGLSANTIATRLNAIRSLLKMARMLGLISWKIEVKSLGSEPYRDTRGPGYQGYLQIVNGIKGDSQRDRRDRAIIMLAFVLGLRRNEIATLDLEHVDFERKAISVLRKKRTDRQLLGMPDSLVKAIGDWIELRSDVPGPLFVSLDNASRGNRLNGGSIWRIVESRSRAAGIKGCSPHRIRHAAITRALDLNGGDIRKVRQFSGHRRLETLSIYDDRRHEFQANVANQLAGS